MDMNEKLTANFRLGEFYNPGDKGTTWRSRTWPQKVITALPRPAKELYTALQIIRDVVKKAVIVGSGVRSEAHNASVGGSSNSGHMSGAAADISVQGYTNIDLGELVIKLFLVDVLKPYLAYTYLIEGNTRTRVHIGVDVEVPRNSIWGPGYANCPSYKLLTALSSTPAPQPATPANDNETTISLHRTIRFTHINAS